jgi:hypothetical protein
MNTKTKAFSIILASVVVSMLIYSPLTQATNPSVTLGDELPMGEIRQFNNVGFRARPRVKSVLWFLKNSEPTQVDGTVVLLTKKILILNTVEDQIRVNLPAEWIIGNEVVTREDLFTRDYLNEGQSITVKTLGANLIDKDGVRIYLLVGYEIINELGVHATANLPINIED